MPPLTPAEKMRRYRAKMKENSDKFLSVKKKDRERKALKKALRTTQEQKTENGKNRMRVQRYREKLKDISSTPRARSFVNDVALQTPTKVFNSAQALGRARSRIRRQLPKSPRKRAAVVLSLAAEYGLTPKRPNVKTGHSALSQETIDMVEKFYIDVSWACPGMKDVVIVRKRNSGEKEKLQKHYLLTTLKEAHAMFEEEHPEVHVSFSKFAELRPVQVQLQKNIPHMTCLCKLHENVHLLLVALQKAGLNVKLQFREFISQVVCDQNNEECMNSQCTACPNSDELKPSEDIENNEIEWYQWSTNVDGKADKIVQGGSVSDCFNELRNQMPNFLLHTHIKRQQASSFQQEKESTKANNSKIVIQVDFAENYSTVSKDEIQSAYWSTNQITLFTCCAWEYSGSHSLAIVSDYLSHDKYAVAVFLNIIMKHFEDKLHHFD
jgi:hypothetical protein